MPGKKKTNKLEIVPRHIAIIMDGNGRWAKARLLPRMAGHRAGAENLRDIIRACVTFGVEYLTIYAFSTENWKRPKDEVEGLMKIFSDVLSRETPELNEEGVQIRHIGDFSQLFPETKKVLTNSIHTTKNNSKLILNIAFNYGGRDEIVNAIKQIVKKGIQAEKIDMDTVEKFLYTKDCPDPDLVIRTSGEIRTSNYLLWQSAYSEWYFSKKYWPDFKKVDLREAIIDFANRTRRFGGRIKNEEKELYDG